MPLQRASRCDGFFPVNLAHREQLALMADEVRSLKQGIGGVGRGRYDIVAALPPGLDPDPHLAAGATWWLVEFPRDDPSIDLVRGVILDGPGSTKLSTT